MKYVLFVCNHNAGRSQAAQKVRLARQLPDLVREFEGRSAGEIRACADALLDRDDDVPVRSYVVALAQRATPECLAGETCDALAVTR